MYQYIIKRLLLMIPTLFGAALLVFVLMRLIPGDVCEVRLAGFGTFADPEALEICRQNLGLYKPWFLAWPPWESQFGQVIWGYLSVRPETLRFG